MKKLFSLLAGFSALAALSVPAPAATQFEVEKLPPLAVAGTQPAQGVAGAFAFPFLSGKPNEPARVNIAVAGGCNFPEKGPADGGKKVFYDTVWLLDTAQPGNGWKVGAQKLPAPVAYGVTAGSVCIGGENSEKKFASAFLPLGKNFADLPAPLDNAAGTVFAAGKKVAIFVAGGNANGVPANKAFRLESLDAGMWETLPDFPGTPRVQPVAGRLETPRGKAFALVGGFYFDKEKGEATLDRAGVIFYPNENKWEKIPPMPEEISEAGLVGAAATEYDGGLLIVGGVNAEIFKNAVEKPAPDYLRHDPAWYKFNADAIFLAIDADGNAVWKKLGSVPAFARAGASLVPVSADKFAYICGESKPGVRSTDCVLVKISK